jgi:hypothetical protein
MTLYIPRDLNTVTTRSRMRLEKVIVPHLVNKFLAFYGNRKVFFPTRPSHLSLS